MLSRRLGSPPIDDSSVGYAGYGAIVPSVPLFMFVFLFGLSMDYHVFILSRIRDRPEPEYGRGPALPMA
jgi:RND superfamily putative drug exporter